MAGKPAEKDLAVLKQMLERAHELVAQYENLPDSEQVYARKLVRELTELVEAFRRLTIARLDELKPKPK